MPGRSDVAAIASIRERWRIYRAGRADDHASAAWRVVTGLLTKSAFADVKRLSKSAGKNWLFSPHELKNAGYSFVAAQRLHHMALALASGRFSSDESLRIREVLSTSLRTFVDFQYSARTEIVGNWWYYCIGIPLQLADACLLVWPDEHFRDEVASTIAKFSPDPLTMHAFDKPSTGANRVWLANLALKRALLVDDSKSMKNARAALLEALAFSPEGDGLRADGSFIQHDNVSYNGGYGVSFLVEAVDALALLHRSRWSFPPEAAQFLVGFIERGIAPFVVNGAMMDMVRGREIARLDTPATEAVRMAASAAMALSGIAEDAAATCLRQWARSWVSQQGMEIFLDNRGKSYLVTPGCAAQVAAAFEETGDVPFDLDGPSDHRQFPDSNRFVHRMKGVAVGLATSSGQIVTHEETNSENLHGAFTGHGTYYIHGAQTGRLAQEFWPTVDPWRLPGTTVERKADGHHLPKPRITKGAIVGCTQIGGNGAVMFGTTDKKRLKTSKSYFFFDGVIVALGAGISPTDKSSIVETIVDNMIVGDDVEVGSYGSSEVGGEQTLPASGVIHPDWIYVDGHAAYVFDLEGGPAKRNAIRVLREVREGTWRRINRLIRTRKKIRQRYLTFWIDHNLPPESALYAYAILPNASTGETRAFIVERQVSILARTPDVHAVRHHGLGIFAMNCYRVQPWRSPTTVGPVSVDGPCSVMMREVGRDIEISVARSVREHDTSFTATFAVGPHSVVVASAGVEVESDGERILVRIQPGPAHRRSISIRARRELSVAD